MSKSYLHAINIEFNKYANKDKKQLNKAIIRVPILYDLTSTMISLIDQGYKNSVNNQILPSEYKSTQSLSAYGIVIDVNTYSEAFPRLSSGIQIEIMEERFYNLTTLGEIYFTIDNDQINIKDYLNLCKMTYGNSNIYRLTDFYNIKELKIKKGLYSTYIKITCPKIV